MGCTGCHFIDTNNFKGEKRHLVQHLPPTIVFRVLLKFFPIHPV